MRLKDLAEDIATMHPDDRLFAKYSKAEVLNCLRVAIGDQAILYRIKTVSAAVEKATTAHPHNLGEHFHEGS